MTLIRNLGFCQISLRFDKLLPYLTKCFTWRIILTFLSWHVNTDFGKNSLNLYLKLSCIIYVLQTVFEKDLVPRYTPKGVSSAKESHRNILKNLMLRTKRTCNARPTRFCYLWVLAIGLFGKMFAVCKNCATTHNVSGALGCPVCTHFRHHVLTNLLFAYQQICTAVLLQESATAPHLWR